MTDDLIPWPAYTDGSKFTDKITLDHTTVLDYLDAPAALPLRHTVANIIAAHGCKTVVDVGCGVGRMSSFIDVDSYMGFDDDIRLIRKAVNQYANDKTSFRVASWKDTDEIQVDYPVDCLLLLGVLSYAMPEYPAIYDKNGFHRDVWDSLIKLYKPKLVIVQEILADQTHVAETNELQVLPLDYYKSLPHVYHELDLPIWCGHRAILEIDTTTIKE
mgnify:CR=1 FL=1|jgi:SAM-dependent methyltransferase